MPIVNNRREHAIGLFTWPVLLATMLVLNGCGEQERSIQGFVLPEGDITEGQASFVDYGCTNCHVVSETDVAYIGDEAGPRIQLGGAVRKVRSYGELLTSIVDPNHSLAQQYLKSLPRQERGSASSPMPDLNEQLTVADLIDLVEFLHSRYEETVPEYVGRRYVR